MPFSLEEEVDVIYLGIAIIAFTMMLKLVPLVVQLVQRKFHGLSGK